MLQEKQHLTTTFFINPVSNLDQYGQRIPAMTPADFAEIINAHAALPDSESSASEGSIFDVSVDSLT